jgi:predicted homoserine dehydrogenase-like protein
MVLGYMIALERAPMLLDEEGVPCIVQAIRWQMRTRWYVSFFDGSSVYVNAELLDNHYQVVHSLSQTGYYNFQPIIAQLEEIYREGKKRWPVDEGSVRFFYNIGFTEWKSPMAP